MLSLTDILNITRVILFYSTSDNLGKAEKYEEGKMHPSCNTQRSIFSGKPHHRKLETSHHPDPHISSGKKTTPSLPPSIFPSVSIPPCSRMNYWWLHDNGYIPQTRPQFSHLSKTLPPHLC